MSAQDETRPAERTDADQVDETAPAASGAPRRRPSSPAAAAASRARRIGGRPVAGRSGGSEAGEGAATREWVVPEEAVPPPADDSAPRPPRAPSLRKGPKPDAAPDTPQRPDTTDTPAGAVPAAERAQPPVPVWLNWAPAGVLAAGALVMAVLLVVFSHGVWWGPDPGRAPSAAKVAQVRDQVQAAAKSCVAAANDYSYTALDAYEHKALACTTGQLTGKLKSTIDSLIKKNAPQIKAKQTTQINRGGIQSVTPDGKQWAILLFGQLSVVNANYPKGRTDPFGALVTMEKSHGKWLMANLQTVSSPVSGG